jgi:hypothetical protein
VSASDQAARLAVLDLLIDNSDRHQGNWLVGRDGALAGIDQGCAWSALWARMREKDSPYFGNRMTEFMQGPGMLRFRKPNSSGLSDNPLTASDIAFLRARINEVRPDFEKLGRGEMLEFSLVALSWLERFAKGTRSIFGA